MSSPTKGIQQILYIMSDTFERAEQLWRISYSRNYAAVTDQSNGRKLAILGGVTKSSTYGYLPSVTVYNVQPVYAGGTTFNPWYTIGMTDDA